jgi:hypothetical protein
MVITWPRQSMPERRVRKIARRASVTAQCGVEQTEEAGAQAAGKAHGWQAEERHQRLGTGHGREAEQGAHGAPDSPAPYQHQTLATFGKLIGELRRHPATEGVADDGHPLHLQHRQQVAHTVGEPRDRVVGTWLLRAPVSEEVRGDHRVMRRQLIDDRPPRVRAVADAVDQQQSRPAASLDVGAAVPVHRDVAHAECTLSPDPGAESDLRGIDRPPLDRLSRPRSLHLDLPIVGWSPDRPRWQ